MTLGVVVCPGCGEQLPLALGLPIGLVGSGRPVVARASLPTHVCGETAAPAEIVPLRPS